MWIVGANPTPAVSAVGQSRGRDGDRHGARRASVLSRRARRHRAAAHRRRHAAQDPGGDGRRRSGDLHSARRRRTGRHSGRKHSAGGPGRCRNLASSFGTSDGIGVRAQKLSRRPHWTWCAPATIGKRWAASSAIPTKAGFGTKHDRLRLLAIIEAYSITGPAKNLLEFARLARAADVETTIATFTRGASSNLFIDTARADGIPVEVIQESGLYDRSVIRNLSAARRAPAAGHHSNPRGEVAFSRPLRLAPEPGSLGRLPPRLYLARVASAAL